MYKYCKQCTTMLMVIISSNNHSQPSPFVTSHADDRRRGTFSRPMNTTIRHNFCCEWWCLESALFLRNRPVRLKCNWSLVRRVKNNDSTGDTLWIAPSIAVLHWKPIVFFVISMSRACDWKTRANTQIWSWNLGFCFCRVRVHSKSTSHNKQRKRILGHVKNIHV